MDRLITIKEFCRDNGVSRSTVYREIKAGRLPVAKIGRATRFFESAVITWQQSLLGSGRV